MPAGELGVDPDAIGAWERPEVVADFEQLRARCDLWAAGGCEIGLVPTMGALHEGHLSLLRRARAECDRVVVTIFVNPLQFGPHEDFSEYPRRLAQDVECLRAEAIDLVFAPVEGSISDGFCSHIGVGAEAETMEGAVRPGHFSGVATIVAILWGVVRPDRAYFGRNSLL